MNVVFIQTNANIQMNNKNVSVTSETFRYIKYKLAKNLCPEVFWLVQVEELCDGNDKPLAKACCIMIGTEHQCKNSLDNCFS